MEKLVIIVMGQNCERFISTCLESIKNADDIVFCDGGSEDNTREISKQFGMKNDLCINWIINEYDQEDKGMNGKQRNFYLNYLKENYKDWWCLCLDADEVVDDLQKIKNFINIAPKQYALYSIKMEHFIQDLGHVDNTLPIHFVQNRLFKIRNDLFYPEVEHPVLQSKIECEQFAIQPTTIFHLAYIPNLFEYKKKYENHLKKSEIHSKEFLDNWYRAHIFGRYPKKQIDLFDIPKVILNHFGVEKDEIYFSTRMQLETKHFIMCKEWNDYFYPKDVLDIGCGLGHYGKAWSMIYDDLEYVGIDKSEWAIKNTPYKELKILQQNITKGIPLPDSNYDLVLCIDVLEHLNYKELDFVLNYLPKLGKNFIFSIPFLGDPNLELDKTHLIKESKEWWVKILSNYFKIEDAPKEWLFSNQILIGEKR